MKQTLLLVFFCTLLVAAKTQSAAHKIISLNDCGAPFYHGVASGDPLFDRIIIWTIYKTYYRLVAFWDKTNKEDTIVISTHGLIKKTDKISKNEIDKAERIRLKYFNDKNIKQ